MLSVDSIMTEDDLSLLSCDEQSELLLNKELLCPECWCIPKIRLDQNSQNITTECDFHHNCTYDITQFMKKSTNHSLFDISCSQCQKIQNKLNYLFHYCLECNSFLCNTCYKSHSNNKTKSSHHTITIDKLYSYCLLHSTKFSYYCENCCLNICNKCLQLHENHSVKEISELAPSKEDIKLKKEIIQKQKDAIYNLEEIFKEIITQISNKFRELIEKEVKKVELKEIIISKVENVPSNYYYINNFNNIPNTVHQFSKPFLGSYIQKLKKLFFFLENEEKTDTPDIEVKSLSKIKSINEHKKEIMNMIKLHKGGFATSSWDGTVKIFDENNFNLIQTIKEPKLNDISYVTQISDDSLLICSNIMRKIRLSSDNKTSTTEFIFKKYDDYIIKVIELDNKNIITCDWEYKIKVWAKKRASKQIKKNSNTNVHLINNDRNIKKNFTTNNLINNEDLYYLLNEGINVGEHLSSICKINGVEFVSSSNSHLEHGADTLRFYDKNLVNYETIKNISCSELPDSVCQLSKEILAVALQKWKEGQMRGIALININMKQICKIVQTDAITYISKLSNDLIITGGRELNTKKSIIKLWNLEGINMNLLSENCSEQRDAITSIIELNNGVIACSSYDSTIAILK